MATPALDWPTGGVFNAHGRGNGVDPKVLADLKTTVSDTLPRTRSLIILRGNSMVFEQYFGDATADQTHGIASVTKSVVSMLFGMAVGDGKLSGLDTRIADIYPEEIVEPRDPRTDVMTLKHLLTMTAGLAWIDRGEQYWRWRHSRDRFRAALQAPQKHPPGKVFNYSSPVSHLLGGAVARATGQSLIDYANERLFGPLGERIKYWNTDPLGYNDGSAGIELTPRAMAKLGYLLLRGGRWGEQQIVPNSWIEDASRMHVRFSEHAGYGLHFWVRKFAGCWAYYAAGRGGQYIVVIPEKQLVIVITARLFFQSMEALKYFPVIERIVSATSGRCDPHRMTGIDLPIAAGFFHGAKLSAMPEPETMIVNEFFRALGDRILSRDINAIMAMYSDRYLYDGIDKTERRNFWNRTMHQVTKYIFHPEKISRHENGNRLTGEVELDFGNFLVESFLTRENGRWVLLGSPAGRTAAVRVPEEFGQFVRSFAATLGQGSPDLLPTYFSDQYLSNGFRKSQIVSWLKPILPSLGRTRMVITSYDGSAPVVRVDGWLMGAFGRAPISHLFGHARQEDGEWRWYGNQNPH